MSDDILHFSIAFESSRGGLPVTGVISAREKRALVWDIVCDLMRGFGCKAEGFTWARR